MPGSLAFHDLGEAPDDALLTRFYEQVLLPSFSPGELVPLDALQGGLAIEPRDTDVVVAVDGDGSVVGGAVGDWDGDAGVYLLSYLAVRPTDRSQGVGAQLMDRVRSWWEARGADVVVAEVDDPRHHEVSAYGDPVARLRFYERLGARVLGVRYTQPEVHQGAGRVPGMLLITFPAGPDAGAEPIADALPIEILRRFLGNYLALAEDIAGDQLEAAVDDLVPGLQGLATVPILPMARYVEI